MENLPFELIHRCMSLLHNEERLTCLRVCKTCNKKLRKIAYKTVAVASEEQLAQMHTFFQHNKECGSFVKNLFIIDCKMTAIVYISLPSLFPNIKKFYVKDDDTDYVFPASQYDAREAKTQFTKWKNTIEDITEVGSPICTEALFTRSVCPNLKSLELAFLDSVAELDPIRFIKKLKKSAPNLTHLKLLYMTLDFHNMEELLNSTPNLKVLALSEMRFLPPPKKKFDMAKIEPHPGLETLFIQQGSFCNNANKWIEYFSKKLIYLKNLCLNRMEDNLYQGFREKYEEEMVNWVSKLSQLKYYRVEAFKLTKKIVEAMDKSGMQLKRIDMRRVYTIADFYKWLLDSKQKDSLETISSIDDSYRSIIYEFKDFVPRLGEFKKLKHLSIFQCQSEIELPNKVPLDLFIKHIPNLQTLKMDFGEYIVEYDKDEPMPACKLKTLLLIEFSFNGVNRFKDTEEGHMESREYIEKTVLPKTKFITRDSEDTIAIEEEYSLSVCDFKEYPDCEYDCTTYKRFEVL